MDTIEAILKESIDIKEKLLNESAGEIKKIATVVAETLKKGRGFYLFGNGGSAADAQHIAAELQGRFLMERAAIPVIPLTTNTSTLTAIGNDYGFNLVFTRQVEAFVHEGDAVLGLSTSGNSPNVVDALRLAKSRGGITIGLTGEKGGKMLDYCDYGLKVPSCATPRIQEAHMLIGHIICGEVEKTLFG